MSKYIRCEITDFRLTFLIKNLKQILIDFNYWKALPKVYVGKKSDASVKVFCKQCNGF